MSGVVWYDELEDDDEWLDDDEEAEPECLGDLCDGCEECDFCSWRDICEELSDANKED